MESVTSISKENIQEIKIVLLGNVSVGKSSLMCRFVNDQFDENKESTVGASFMAKIAEYDQKKVNFQIWDTAGQEKYRSLAPMYYKDAQAAIIVYDLTNQDTFNCLQDWFDELKQYGPSDIKIVIAANKSDLVNQYSMDISKAYNMAKDNSCSLCFTSAKTSSGVEDAFNKVAQLVLSSQDGPKRKARQQSLLMSINEQDRQKKQKCC